METGLFNTRNIIKKQNFTKSNGFRFFWPHTWHINKICIFNW